MGSSFARDMGHRSHGPRLSYMAILAAIPMPDLDPKQAWRVAL